MLLPVFSKSYADEKHKYTDPSADKLLPAGQKVNLLRADWQCHKERANGALRTPSGHTDITDADSTIEVGGRNIKGNAAFF